MINVLNNHKESRFETIVDNELALLEYTLYKDAITLTSTKVPEKIGGRGIGTALVKYAFQYAKEHKLAVKPYCSFVVDFINKHEVYKEQLKLD